ncbi:hypothetical protein ABZ897_60130 [Nonomuraea sp. NPDC046802]
MTQGRPTACHFDRPGTAHQLRLCAGRLAVLSTFRSCGLSPYWPEHRAAA